jgi:hypothetical protein
MTNFKFFIFLIGFMIVDNVHLSRIECTSPVGVQERGLPITIKCSAHVSLSGALLLEFDVPHSLKNFSKIKKMNHSSRELCLTLPYNIDYRRAISCKMNKLRSDICFFYIEFTQRTGKQQNYSQVSEFHEEQSSNQRKSDFQPQNLDFSLIILGVLFFLTVILFFGFIYSLCLFCCDLYQC